MIYVQYAVPYGFLLAVSNTVEGLPRPTANSGVKALDAFDEVPPSPMVWNPLELTFTLPNTALLSQLQFFDRFPQAVEDMVYSLSIKDTALGANMRKLLARTAGARGIDPADARVVAGVTAVFNVAVSLNVIADADKQAGIDAVLAPL